MVCGRRGQRGDRPGRADAAGQRRSVTLPEVLTIATGRTFVDAGPCTYCCQFGWAGQGEDDGWAVALSANAAEQSGRKSDNGQTGKMSRRCDGGCGERPTVPSRAELRNLIEMFQSPSLMTGRSKSNALGRACPISASGQNPVMSSSTTQCATPAGNGAGSISTMWLNPARSASATSRRVRSGAS